jgi:ketosteroid isomerase-like protein
MRFIKVIALLGMYWSAAVAMAAPPGNAELKKQVADTERAFAATMKARDLGAFVAFVADDAVFFNGPTPLHGKQAVGEFWKKFFDKSAAPFSWEPDQVEVLASGKLAASSGPVYSPEGKLISRFNSIWRLEADGKWKIVYDKGEPVCDCKKPAGQ